MGRRFEKDLGYGLQMEQRAADYLRKLYPGAMVSIMPQGSPEQKRGIDLLVEWEDRKITVQVKSRPTASDIALEGHWDDGGEWKYDFPQADFFLYHLPSYRRRPLWIPIDLLDVSLGTNVKKFDLKAAPVYQNKDDKKFCKYIKPDQLQGFISMRKIQQDIHVTNYMMSKQKANNKWIFGDFPHRENRGIKKGIMNKHGITRNAIDGKTVKRYNVKQ